MNVIEPLAHGALVEKLWEAAREERLPHALLLEGPEGVGKFEAARWLAAGLLCERGPGRPCESCGACRRVRSGGADGNHPDLLLIDPIETREEMIRVGRIARRPDTDADADHEHCVEAFLGLRAMEGHGRVVLIRECHRMNAAAQNALLKTLEEPGPGTLLVLETHKEAALLPTIASRCIRVRCKALTEEQCVQALVDAGLAEAEARALGRLSEGSPGRALAWKARGVVEIRAHLAAGLRGDRAVQSLVASLLEIEGEYSGKTASARSRDLSRTVLEIGLALLRDARRALAGISVEALAQGELALELSRSRTRAELERTTEAWLQARSDVDRNLTPEGVLERAFMAWTESAALHSGGR